MLHSSRAQIISGQFRVSLKSCGRQLVWNCFWIYLHQKPSVAEAYHYVKEMNEFQLYLKSSPKPVSFLFLGPLSLQREDK